MTATYSLSTGTARRDFWRRFFKLLVVLAGQNIIVFGVNLLDNIMIGQIENADLAISGVFIVNQIQFLLQMIVNGIAEGTVVICSRFWGEKRIEDIRKAASTAMWVGLILSGLLLAAALIFPRQVLSLFTNKAEVIAEAEKYLAVVCYTYLIFTVTQVLLGVLRSVEKAFIGFLTSCTALVVNLTLNYVLIFGRFGFPAMGIRGAAVATLISRAAEFLIVLLYLIFAEKRLRLKLTDFFHIDRGITKTFMRFSLPVILSATSWGIAMGVQAAYLGRLDGPVISANSIATTIFQIMTVFSYGSAAAASVMIGKTLGEGRTAPDANEDSLLTEVKHRARWLQIIFLIIGTVTGLGLFLARDTVIGFYEIMPETRALAAQFITVLSVTAVGTSYQMPCLAGILRGGGDTRFILINDLIFMWGIVLPVSFLAAFVFHLSPLVIFICLKSDQVLKCTVAVVKVNRFRWIKKI